MGNMTDGHQSGQTSEVRPDELPEPELLARLVPYLTESIMVVRRDWTVAADLGPPGGMLGHGQLTGMHPFSVMHPDDVERVADDATRAMRTEPGWRGSLEFRGQRADGSYAVFQVDFHNRFDDPVLDGMVVVSREIPDTDADPTPQLPSELATDLPIGTVGDHLPIGLLMLDVNGSVVFANRSACDLLETDLALLKAGQMPDGLKAEDRVEVVAMLQRLRSSPGKETFTTALAGPSGRLLSGTLVSRAGEGTDGAVQFVIITIEDATHRLAREQHLEHRANHDSLTGLPNRAWLLDRLSVQLAEQNQLTVAFIDLDGFKTVNDRLGHAAGDELLSEIGSSLRSVLKRGESVARVGGDEFVVVAGCPIDHEELRERLREAVSTTVGAQAHSVGASVGVTESRDGDQPWDLLGRADAAMYAEKRRPA
jgi:diguanylate cyclase (GGDEF)-like protein